MYNVYNMYGMLSPNTSHNFTLSETYLDLLCIEIVIDPMKVVEFSVKF